MYRREPSAYKHGWFWRLSRIWTSNLFSCKLQKVGFWFNLWGSFQLHNSTILMSFSFLFSFLLLGSKARKEWCLHYMTVKRNRRRRKGFEFEGLNVPRKTYLLGWGNNYCTVCLSISMLPHKDWQICSSHISILGNQSLYFYEVLTPFATN